MIQSVVRTFYHNYNPASETDFIYGKLADSFQIVPRACKTDGANTTVTDSDTGNNFALAIGVGDVLYNPATGDVTSVLTRTDATEITVADSVTWAAGSNIHVRKFLSGQTEDDGWISVSDLEDVTVHIQVDTIASASITATVESRMPGMNPVTLLTPAAFTAVTVSSTTGVSSFADIAVPESATAVRVGLKVGTDGADVVNAALMGKRK